MDISFLNYVEIQSQNFMIISRCIKLTIFAFVYLSVS